MISSPEVVQRYLDDFCPVAKAGRVAIEGSRPENRAFMQKHGLSLDDIQAYLADLRVEDYSTGPERDDKERPCDIWKFGPDYCSEPLYVKLADWNRNPPKRRHHCVSFKATLSPLSLPYRK